MPVIPLGEMLSKMGGVAPKQKVIVSLKFGLKLLSTVIANSYGAIVVHCDD